MIKIGDEPQNRPNVNKFLTSKDHEGMRGTIIAIKEDGKEAIVLAQNSSFDKQVKWGRLYLVKEIKPEWYPEVVKQVTEIPNEPEWKLVFTIPKATVA